MGNHQAGHAVGITAEALVRNCTNLNALEILDCICEPYRGCDIEFEAEDPNSRGCIHPDYTFYTWPTAPLGSLIAKAFSPDRDWVSEFGRARAARHDSKEWESVLEAWSEGPERQFSQRYEFC